MEWKIRKVLPREMNRVAHLFDGWEETMILSCLQGVMGSVYAEDTPHPESAAAQLNDFCFLAGKPCRALVALDYGREELILTPQNEAWSEMIEATWSDRAVRHTRYAIKKEGDCFRRERLTDFVNRVRKPFEIHRIDRQLYDQCLTERWSADLVAGYPTYEDFCRKGLGFAVTENGRIVSGASSYSSYRGGIEIEVDTQKEYRRGGLATAAASALILECLKRGWYPSWDAHNKASVALARKLGYAFDREYPVYIVKRSC